MEDSEYKQHLEEIARQSYENNDINAMKEGEKIAEKSSRNPLVTIGIITLPVNIVGFLMIGYAVISVFCTGTSCEGRYGFARTVYPITSLIVALVSLIYNICLIKILSDKKQLMQLRMIPVFLSFIPIILTILVFISIHR